MGQIKKTAIKNGGLKNKLVYEKQFYNCILKVKNIFGFATLLFHKINWKVNLQIKKVIGYKGTFVQNNSMLIFKLNEEVKPNIKLSCQLLP